MKPRKLKDLIRSKDEIISGKTSPARVWEIKPDKKGGFKRRELNAKDFQEKQKADWENNISATRSKLHLSQADFAHLLGISVKTLHHWEQGRRTPSGAARVLLRIAEKHPEIVLKAAA